MNYQRGIAVMVGRGVTVPTKARVLAGYATSGMSIDELSTAWNNLRNAALGRGVTPNVSAALANDVGTAYEQWRAYLADKTASAWLPISPTSAVEDVWVQRYRLLVARVQAENVTVPDVLPPTFTEKAKDAAKDIGKNVGKDLAIAVISGLVVAGVMYYYTHRPVSVKVMTANE